MSVLHRHAVHAAILTVVLAGSAAACGDSGGGGAANGLEQSEITVGTMPVGDTAPLHLAISKGLFKAEGLTVKTQMLAGGQQAIPRLKGGQLDISFGNYVSLFAAAAKGDFKPRVVAEAFESGPGTHVLLVSKDSPIKTVKDLAGKKIGVNTKRNVSTLLVRAAAKPTGLELDEDKNFVEVPPPAMQAALKSGSVDAVMAIEPFGTQIQGALGARLLVDLSAGPTAKFPIAGYAASDKFTSGNPKTVAAFQRALLKAQGMAAADQAVVRQILPSYAKGIDPKVAGTMKFGTYPTSLDGARLQRVADVMLQFSYLPGRLEVKPLVAAAP